jgi:hypothetical protein
MNFKVTHWHLAKGRGDGDNTEVVVRLEESSWFWHFAEFIGEHVFFTICDWCHKVPLPKFVCNWERNWGGDKEDGVHKLEDWYGADLGCLWHVYVESPVLQWVWKHKFIEQATEFRMTLAEAREKFKGTQAYKLEWIEEDVKRDAAYAAEHPEDND